MLVPAPPPPPPPRAEAKSVGFHGLASAPRVQSSAGVGGRLNSIEDNEALPQAATTPGRGFAKTLSSTASRLGSALHSSFTPTPRTDSPESGSSSLASWETLGGGMHGGPEQPDVMRGRGRGGTGATDTGFHTAPAGLLTQAELQTRAIQAAARSQARLAELRFSERTNSRCFLVCK